MTQAVKRCGPSSGIFFQKFKDGLSKIHQIKNIQIKPERIIFALGITSVVVALLFEKNFLGLRSPALIPGTPEFAARQAVKSICLYGNQIDWNGAPEENNRKILQACESTGSKRYQICNSLVKRVECLVKDQSSEISFFENKGRSISSDARYKCLVVVEDHLVQNPGFPGLSESEEQKGEWFLKPLQPFLNRFDWNTLPDGRKISDMEIIKDALDTPEWLAENWKKP